MVIYDEKSESLKNQNTIKARETITKSGSASDENKEDSDSSIDNETVGAQIAFNNANIE